MAEKLFIDINKSSNGWIDLFKKKCNLTFKSLKEESNSANH